MGIKNAIKKLMEDSSYTPLTQEEFLEISGFTTSHEKKALLGVLKDMEKEMSIVKNEEGRYELAQDKNLVIGQLDGNERGFGFLIPEDKDLDDIFVSGKNMLNAFSGDKVLCRIIREKTPEKSAEGEIVKIIERRNTKVVGVFQRSKQFGFVVPDDNKIRYDVFIPRKDMLDAKSHQKVVAEITEWPRGGKNPEGKIVEILGYAGEQGVDILSIIKQMGLPYEFSKKVIREAKSAPNKVELKDIENREDLRKLTTFTIDGADAKDLDDAISIEINEKGNYILGVHIADVSHYVPSNSELDREAYKRGNSVYLLDRVVPMLPKELSNGICSLNENQDRLTMSVFMEIDKSGTVVYHKILESVIRSKKRLVYDHVSDFLENGIVDESIEGLEEKLINLEKLSKILKAKRERRGSIDFDIPETQIILDENGHPEEIKPRERRIGDKLIEECMLICNETVAEDMFWVEIPFIYRTHEEPDSDRIETFNKFIHNFGYSIKSTQEIHPKELQKITQDVKGKKEESLINTLMLRSLKKAIYSEEDGIHFGLAARYYTHFTAPIRRYSDLIVHRIVKKHINGKMNLKEQAYFEEFLPKLAEHVSKTERVAEEAERQVEDLKMAEYMLDRIGNEYTGIVSSLTHFGIFVQLENTIEGLIRYEYLRDDYYIFDEENYYVYGERGGKEYRLGDIVKIKVINADLFKRTIDFIFVEEEDLDEQERHHISY